MDHSFFQTVPSKTDGTFDAYQNKLAFVHQNFSTNQDKSL